MSKVMWLQYKPPDSLFSPFDITPWEMTLKRLHLAQNRVIYSSPHQAAHTYLSKRDGKRKKGGRGNI